MSNKIKYQVIEAHKDPSTSVIKKTGTQEVNSQFSLQDIVKELKSFQKIIQEKESQAKIHAAEMKNVETQHEGVLKVDEKLRQAIYVHTEAKINYETNKEIVDRYQAGYDELKKEMDEIIKKLHLPTPVLE